MKARLGRLLAAVLCLGLAALSPAQTGPAPVAKPDWVSVRQRGFTLECARGSEGQAKALSTAVALGMGTVQAFLGKPYPEAFKVRLFPDRASLTEQWRKDWKAPDLQPECWMVASGTASLLDVLSPAVWKTQGCDHDPSDAKHVSLLLTHELVHVYHGQRNPNPTFDGLDDLGWFIEGLAVYASGQLDATRLSSCRAAVAAGRVPARLKDAWSGKDRYGVAGSMVEFIDRKYGRAVLVRLLPCTDQGQILNIVGLSEEDFLARWKEDLLAGALAR